MRTLDLALFVALGVCSTGLVAAWIHGAPGRSASIGSSAPGGRVRGPSAAQATIGFLTNFFDTLGIGSFATTTCAFQLLRLVRDECIPGTLNVGHALPVVVQAFIFISVIRIDPFALVSLIVASLAGGWLGAGIVAGLSKRAIRIGLGTALLVGAVFMIVTQAGLLPGGGSGLRLSATGLGIALGVNFVLGGLLTLGLGNYAPSLVLFSLLGTDPRAAFPVMMGSAAFVASVAGVRYISSGRYDRRAALGLTAGGIPAVLIAGLLVRSLSLEAMQWLALGIVVYTGVTMLWAAARDRQHSYAGATAAFRLSSD